MTSNKTALASYAALAAPLMALVGGQSAFAQETRPPLVRQLYNGNWPSEEEAQQLRDELCYQRAIHAYMAMQPVLNVIGMRDGSKAKEVRCGLQRAANLEGPDGLPHLGADAQRGRYLFDELSRPQGDGAAGRRSAGRRH